jgi:stage II sporulation protein D
LRTVKLRKTDAFQIQAVFLLLLLLGFSTACGKKNSQVRNPVPQASSSSKPAEPESAKQKMPGTQTQPPAAGKPEHPAAADSPGSGTTAPVNKNAGPIIRIGLTTSAKEIRISSSGKFTFMEKTPEAPRQTVQGDIRVRVEREDEETKSVFQIQVASYSKVENAEDLIEKLSKILDVPIAIHQNAAIGAHQVRIGEFPSKKKAQNLLKTIKDVGYPDAFIVAGTVSEGTGKPTLAARGSNNLFRVNSAGFLFQPSSTTSFLSLNGKAYRGSIDVLLNKHGSMTVVNSVGMEDYLLSVVPSEMSPSTYPEFAALAAQAIAARTYALKNMGRFRSEGFDLTNDTRSQVYTGLSGEKSATDDAVTRTFGLAVFYQDKPIDAMYMSTCGGRTEDYSNVFGGPPVPYLKSVFCAIESGPEKDETVLEGKHELEKPFLADDGSLANRNLELAEILGLIEHKAPCEPEYFEEPTRKDEAIRWTEAAGKIANETPPRNSPSKNSIETRAGFLRFAAESFFGVAEIERKISTRDADYYIDNLKDGGSVHDSARRAIAYLLQKGFWRPFADNTVRPDEPIRRGDAIALLIRWIESIRPDLLRKSIFVGANLKKKGDDPVISVKWGSGTREFSLAPKRRLFRLDPGRTTPVSSIRIIGNEKIGFHINASGAIDFLEIELNPTGAASDRYSPSSTWETKIARSTVAEKLQGLASNIGEFRDLKPARIGESGRVVQIQAIGSQGSSELSGYKVKSALGLKDTLFTLTREHNPDGSIANFVFAGRGWGHGVGLCQVGAYGMARAGRSYEDILKTYYQGVEIRKAY